MHVHWFNIELIKVHWHSSMQCVPKICKQNKTFFVSKNENYVLSLLPEFSQTLKNIGNAFLSKTNKSV